MAASSPSMTPSATAQEALHALLREVLPPQGRWSDEEYLWLTDRCNRLIEFTDGHVQELPMPTFTHHAVLLALYRGRLRRVTASRGIRRGRDGRVRRAEGRRLTGGASSAVTVSRPSP